MASSKASSDRVIALVSQLVAARVIARHSSCHSLSQLGVTARHGLPRLASGRGPAGSAAPDPSPPYLPRLATP